MSQISHENAFDRAVDLVLNCDKSINDWSNKIITIQTSLVIAEAALLAWKGESLSNVLVLTSFLIGALAISLMYLTSKIVVRYNQWQKVYVESVKKSEGDNPFIYKPNENMEGRNISQLLTIISRIIIAAWAIFLLLLVAQNIL